MSCTDGKVILSASYLKELRRNNGLSQEKLAQKIKMQKLNLSIATIKRAEAGKMVNYGTAFTLAEFYNIAVADLFSTVV